MEQSIMHNALIAQCQLEIKNIQSHIDALRNETISVQNNLEKQKHVLQALCEVNGHDYTCDRSYQCYSSYNTFTCELCGHFTMIQPKKIRKS
jgi:hypothetical protein